MGVPGAMGLNLRLVAKQPYPTGQGFSLVAEVEKCFSSNCCTVQLLREKFESLVGIDCADLVIDHYNEGDLFVQRLPLVAAETLESLGVSSGDKLQLLMPAAHCVNEGEAAEKFVLSDAEYASRADTFRTWKKNLVIPEQAVEVASEMEKANSTLQIGKRCITSAKGHARIGTIRWIGHLAGKSCAGIWVGIELDLPLGSTNGTLEGVEYFKCRSNHAVFTKASLVHVEEEAEGEEMEL